MTFSCIRQSWYSRLISLCVVVTFVATMIITPRASYAQAIAYNAAGQGGVLGLPSPGTMVDLSSAYVPLMITGLSVHPENPLLMDFIVSTGNSGLNVPQVKKESDRLIKYFLACLTIPENNQWVNLSPYEKDRIVPEDLGQTVLGRDMLAQDYLLKQLTASLINPEKNLGKDFWDKVYAKANQMYGTTQIPVNTFNKVWILPDTAKVYEHKDTVFVVKSHLKVMLDEDYLALSKHNPSAKMEENSNSLPQVGRVREGGDRAINTLGNQIVRAIILPAIEQEVNTGKNFAQLRQIYNSMILAVWFKKNLRQALLNQVYTDKSKVNGVNVDDPAIKEKIYKQYLQAYKKGVFNYIKEESFPPLDGEGKGGVMIPRKYFSGGLTPFDAAMLKPATLDEAMATFNDMPGKIYRVSGLTQNVNGARAVVENVKPVKADKAMTTRPSQDLENILSRKLLSTKARIKPLLDAYYTAKARGEVDEVKRLDGEINKIIDELNVYNQSKPEELKLSDDVESLTSFLSSPNVGGYQGVAKLDYLDGNYVPQFIFAGAATRLNRGPMYNLDIWDIAIELGKAKPEDAKYRMGMGPRQIMAYRLALEEMAKQNGESPQQVLARQKMIINVNADIEQTVVDDFINNGFYGFKPENVYFIVQPTYHGYKFQSGSLEFAPQSPTVPYGHGHNFMQLGENGQAFTLGTDGNRNYLQGSILDQFSDSMFIGSHRINDLTKLSKDSVISVDKLAFAIAKFGEGSDVVAELVDNPNKQKGGNVLKDTRTGKSFLIETSNVKGAPGLVRLLDEAGKVGAPYNAFRLVYMVGNLKRILKKSLPFNLRFKDGDFYLEAVTGDVTQMTETNAKFMSSGEQIHDFKEPKNIADALIYLRQSDDQLASAGVNKAMTVEIKPLAQTRPTKFGTSGDRGIIDWDGDGKGDFNIDLVRRDTQGIAAHLLNTTDQRTIIIGYDTRHRNPEFSKEAARIMAGNGFKVLYVAQGVMPTPVLAILAANRKVAGVINFTASHSPYMDDGLKFSPSHGGAADTQTTDAIEQLANVAKEFKVINYDEAVRDGQITELNPEEAVEEYVNGYLIPTLKNTKAQDGASAWDDIVTYIKNHPEFSLVVDPMQGTGVRTVQVLYGKIAEAAGRPFFRVIHTDNKDPKFTQTGGAPQPAGKYIQGLLDEVKQAPHTMGIAIDGDVDRFGVVDFGGKQFEANEMIGMFAWFLKNDIGLDGSLIKTVATSNFANAVAKHLGIKLIETPVGFKYAVQLVMNGEKVLLAGEESAHVGIGPFLKSWDDGFAVGLTALWLVAKSGKTLAEYKSQIETEIAQSFVLKVHTARDEKGVAKARVIALITAAKDEMQSKPATEISLAKKAEGLTGQKVVGIDTKDGVKLIFETGDSILMRPSGTEPAAKLYVEVSNPGRLDTMFKDASKLMGVDQAQLTLADSNSFDDQAEPIRKSNQASLANPGGIDINARNLNMESSGQKVNITFDPAMIEQFKRGDFSGVKIQILDVVPINLMPLLGLKEDLALH